MEKDFKERLSGLFNGLSVPKIADKMGVPYSTLMNWVTGRTDFPPDELAKIARLTGGSLTYLLIGEGEKYLNSSKHINLDETFRDIVREIVIEELELRDSVNLKGGIKKEEQIETKKIELFETSEQLNKKKAS